MAPMDVKEALQATEVQGSSATEPQSSEKHNETSETLSSHPSSDQAREHDVEKSAGANAAVEADPNIVDFDGPDDPENPLNWTSRQKWSIVSMLAGMTFITPLASSMFAPGVPQVMEDFHSTSTTLAGFVVSVYVLGYAAGPLVIAPMSELYGRTPVYHTCNVLFIIFTIACAVASNLNMLIGFRFLEGFAGACVITIGGGTVADLFKQEDRGKAMSLWSMGPLVGPVAGPVAGGFLAQAVSWRWVFWVIAIAAGCLSIVFIFFLRETYAPVIIERKVRRLRKETGNSNLRSKVDKGLTPTQLFKLAIVRPLKMLVFSPIVLILSLIMSVVYGYLYLLFTTITEVFELDYHFGSGVVGLTYIGIGVGMFSGLLVFGIASDRALKARKAKGQEMKPEHRLPLLVPGFIAIPIGLFIYGWTAQYHVFWFVPIFGTAFVGIGLIGTFMPISTYLVDAFTVHAASAIGANTILRSLVGAILPLAGQPMYATLGLGWGNSLLAFIAIAMLPVPFLLMKYGERIRTNPKFQPNL